MDTSCCGQPHCAPASISTQARASWPVAPPATIRGFARSGRSAPHHHSSLSRAVERTCFLGAGSDNHRCRSEARMGRNQRMRQPATITFEEVMSAQCRKDPENLQGEKSNRIGSKVSFPFPYAQMIAFALIANSLIMPAAASDRETGGCSCRQRVQHSGRAPCAAQSRLGGALCLRDGVGGMVLGYHDD